MKTLFLIAAIALSCLSGCCIQSDCRCGRKGCACEPPCICCPCCPGHKAEKPCCPKCPECKPPEKIEVKIPPVKIEVKEAPKAPVKAPVTTPCH